jgi:hypothetical protein
MNQPSRVLEAGLWLNKFAFPCNALIRFVCTFDAVLELAPVVWELFRHFVDPPGTLRLTARLSITFSPT